jgi:hypothetical protein
VPAPQPVEPAVDYDCSDFAFEEDALVITIAAGPNRYEDRGRPASTRRTASTLRASGAEPGGDHSLARTNRTRGCSISRSVHNISTTTMQSLARPALNSTFRAHDR